MPFRRTAALALAAFLALAGGLHGHTASTGGGESCTACLLHDAGGVVPEAAVLPAPVAAEWEECAFSSAPLASRPVEGVRFETGPPRAG